MHNGINVYMYFFMVLWILFQLYSSSPVTLFFISGVKVRYRAIYNGLSTPIPHVHERAWILGCFVAWLLAIDESGAELLRK